MSGKKRLGRNPLSQAKPVKEARPMENVIDHGPESLGSLEKLKSLNVQVDWSELFETTLGPSLKRVSKLLQNFQ